MIMNDVSSYFVAPTLFQLVKLQFGLKKVSINHILQNNSSAHVLNR
jgi:hypothetical protein